MKKKRENKGGRQKGRKEGRKEDGANISMEYM
jgi:hypothetical protein